MRPLKFRRNISVPATRTVFGRGVRTRPDAGAAGPARFNSRLNGVKKQVPHSLSDCDSNEWSVSRTSNLFFVGLLFPIFASEPNGFLEVGVVLENAEGTPRVLFLGGTG